MMIATTTSSGTVNCDRTCSITSSCDTCPDNPNKQQNYVDVSIYSTKIVSETSGCSRKSGKNPTKNLSGPEKKKLRQHWNAIQDKHSRRK